MARRMGKIHNTPKIGVKFSGCCATQQGGSGLCCSLPAYKAISGRQRIQSKNAMAARQDLTPLSFAEIGYVNIPKQRTPEQITCVERNERKGIRGSFAKYEQAKDLDLACTHKKCSS